VINCKPNSIEKLHKIEAKPKLTILVCKHKAIYTITKIGKLKKKKGKETRKTGKRIFTREKFESSWSSSPLCNPKHIFLLIHLQPRINNYRPHTLMTNKQTHINNKSPFSKLNNKNQ
jgi:hypothetical protein